ncbi:MAG: 2-oxoacid:ferredoxin oxidoreductase subunit beta [Phycisphaerae bacterium]|nr:2-oxoacid:ferredoxin oxidoreductase subunit beta [Phycisphaerae bacterium]
MNVPHVERADTTPALCPGCGNYPILSCLQAALEQAGVDRRNVVLVSGIGQAAKLPHYVTGGVNVFNGLHGRAIPAATGIKLANHKLQVIITSGDGDMYGEGGNHLLHAIRRNISLKAFVHNNQVYGLTKGQASPTSQVGFVTPAQPHGVVAAPLNPLAMAIVEGCALVARSFSGDKEHLTALMVEALRHEGGFVLLDILQPCVTFNRINTFQWYKQRVRRIGDEHDPFDRGKALELAMRWGDEIPIGVLYRCKRPTFESRLGVLAERTLLEQCARAES